MQENALALADKMADGVAVACSACKIIFFLPSSKRRQSSGVLNFAVAASRASPYQRYMAVMEYGWDFQACV